MAWETHPVTPDRFDDFADVVNPNHRPTHCWCLSHRLRAKEIEELGGDGRDARERAARALCAGGVPARAVVCVVVRGGWRRQGVTSQVIEGAVAFAAEHGASAVEAYPVDAEGGRIDTTMAFVGTRTMFEKVGFEVVGTTDALASKRPRLRMRRVLT